MTEGENKPGERSLWASVISQAIADATAGSDFHLFPIDERTRARTWLTVPNRDFDQVCALAGVEPCKVRAFAAKMIAEAEAKASVPVAPRKPRLSARRIEFNGEVKTIHQWSKDTGLSEGNIRNRLKLGWTVEEALSTGIGDAYRKDRTSPGVGENFPNSLGTGGGSSARDRAEIGIL